MPQALSCRIHRSAHARDTWSKPDEERLAHEEVSDIQLDDLGDRRHRAHIVEVEPMTGMHLEPRARGGAGAFDETGELARDRRRIALEASQ